MYKRWKVYWVSGIELPLLTKNIFKKNAEVHQHKSVDLESQTTPLDILTLHVDISMEKTDCWRKCEGNYTERVKKLRAWYGLIWQLILYQNEADNNYLMKTLQSECIYIVSP